MHLHGGDTRGGPLDVLAGASAEAFAAVGIGNVNDGFWNGKHRIAFVLGKLQGVGDAYLGQVAANAGHRPGVAQRAARITGCDDGPVETVVERIFYFDIVNS